MKLTLVATCMFGLEKQVGEEIDALGLHRLETMDGRVTFEGEEADVARANLSLRCAERVFIRLGYFPAHSFTELFDGTNALPWEEWIGREDAFPVKGHSIRSALTSIPDCQSIVKKAVVERLKRRYRVDWFRETGVKYQIEFFLFKDMAALMLDTSGTALHKRGYRPAAGAAPAPGDACRRHCPDCPPARGHAALGSVLRLRHHCHRGGDDCHRARARTGAPFCRGGLPLPAAQAMGGRAEAARAAVRTDSRFEAYASDIDEEIRTRSTRTPCVRGWNST